MRWVLPLLVLLPLVELFLLLVIDRAIGFWPTVALTIVTGLAGGALARREGLGVWRAWRRALEEARAPEQGLVDGVLVLLGGALLVTPGVLTDVTGFLLLLPPTRRLLARRVRAAIDRRLEQSSGFSVLRGVSLDSAPDGWSDGEHVIETSGEALDEAAPESSARSRSRH